MINKITKTTKNFTKKSGMILCNKEQQEELVTKELRSHGYKVLVADAKGGKAQIKYSKE